MSLSVQTKVLLCIRKCKVCKLFTCCKFWRNLQSDMPCDRVIIVYDRTDHVVHRTLSECRRKSRRDTNLQLLCNIDKICQ